MTERPYVLLSFAASLDGYIDDATDRRLLLSNDEDFARVDEVRAGCDAILVGATTIRRDNPRLLVRSAAHREARVARGLTESPIKVMLSSTGDLDPGAAFFTAGDVDKVVYCSGEGVEKARDRVGAIAAVVDAGSPLSLETVLADLHGRGVRRLMVEGGGHVHTLFLQAGLVDEIHAVFAPFFVGDATAPRFVNPGVFPHDAGHRMHLAETRQIGDCVLLRYLTGGAPDA
ncbi:RibD family protein [Embleya sp. AB8]|uniref:RibD family protein n=1 Tax=Embleya sp. AB8 TaxID=3156304 RepID=UPI003C71544F